MRTTLALRMAAIVGLVAVVAGCTGDDGGGDDAAPKTEATTTTEVTTTTTTTEPAPTTTTEVAPTTTTEAETPTEDDFDLGIYDDDPRAPAVVDDIRHQIDLPAAWLDREVWNVVVAACSVLYVEDTVEDAVESFVSAPDAEYFANQIAVLGVPKTCPEVGDDFTEAMQPHLTE